MFREITDEIHELIDKYSEASTMQTVEGRAYHAFPLYHSANQMFLIGASESPVVKYAEKHSLKEIVGDYKKPEGLEFGEMQDYIVMLDDSLSRNNISKQEYRDRIDRVWNALTELNPELKNIDVAGFASTQKKRAAIIGVDDGYNISDLDFFNRNLVEMRSRFNAEGQRKLNRGVFSISDEYDVLANYVADTHGHMGWRPSSHTLNYIKDKYLGKNPSPDKMHSIKRATPVRRLVSKLGF